MGYPNMIILDDKAQIATKNNIALAYIPAIAIKMLSTDALHKTSKN